MTSSTQNKDYFNVHDHVIWETDTHPTVCYLKKEHSKGFIAEDGEIVTYLQLEGARKATGKEIHDHYIERVEE